MSQLSALSLEDSFPQAVVVFGSETTSMVKISRSTPLEGFLRQGSHALNLGLSKIHKGAILTAKPHQKDGEF